jgi:DNA-directed RNA polymerase subunit RPC12/RpoP
MQVVEHEPGCTCLACIAGLLSSTARPRRAVWREPVCAKCGARLSAWWEDPVTREITCQKCEGVAFYPEDGD